MDELATLAYFSEEFGYFDSLWETFDAERSASRAYVSRLRRDAKAALALEASYTEHVDAPCPMSQPMNTDLA